MSLRTQIHHAIDDVAPPAPTLERRVRAFVLSDEPDRKHLVPRRQPRWVAPLGLIAAALVLALVAGLFVAGRIWRNENLPPQTVSQPELKSLEGRPLHVPPVAVGAECPSTPVTLNQQFGLVIGEGPVFLGDSEIYEVGDWGYWVGLGFVSADANQGLVLIRARDLKADAVVAFAQYPLAPTAVTAIGSVLGTAHVVNHKVTLRSEAVFKDPARASPGYPELFVLFGMHTGSSGCIGFQVDGPDFTENFVIVPGQHGV